MFTARDGADSALIYFITFLHEVRTRTDSLSTKNRSSACCMPQTTHLTRFLGPAAWFSVHRSFAGLLSLPLCFPSCLQTLRFYGSEEPSADLPAHTSSPLLLKILRQAGEFLPKEPPSIKSPFPPKQPAERHFSVINPWCCCWGN